MEEENNGELIKQGDVQEYVIFFCAEYEKRTEFYILCGFLCLLISDNQK
jgi:hypothetical protein